MTREEQIELKNPERFCHNCGRDNPSWHAPNELWNKVTGHPAGLVLCPFCFQRAAGKKGIALHYIIESVDARLSSGWRDAFTEEPKTKGEYLVTVLFGAKRMVQIGFWKGDRWNYGDVVAFQRLPSPFTKEGT